MTNTITIKYFKIEIIKLKHFLTFKATKIFKIGEIFLFNNEIYHNFTIKLTLEYLLRVYYKCEALNARLKDL